MRKKISGIIFINFSSEFSILVSGFFGGLLKLKVAKAKLPSKMQIMVDKSWLY